MHREEWYFQIGYVEILYAAMVAGIAVALYCFSRIKQVSEFAAGLIEERKVLIGLIGLAILLFILNRLLGDVW